MTPDKSGAKLLSFKKNWMFRALLFTTQVLLLLASERVDPFEDVFPIKSGDIPLLC